VEERRTRQIIFCCHRCASLVSSTKLSIVFQLTPLSLLFLLELNKILYIAYTNAYIGCPRRLCHYLIPGRVYYSLMACPRSVALGSAFCSCSYLYCCTTDNDAYWNCLQRFTKCGTSPAFILPPNVHYARGLARCKGEIRTTQVSSVFLEYHGYAVNSRDFTICNRVEYMDFSGSGERGR